MTDRMGQDERSKLAQGLRKLSNSGSGLNAQARQGLRRHASNLLKISDVEASSGSPSVGSPKPRVGAPLPSQRKPGEAEYDHEGSREAARSAIKKNPAVRERVIQRLLDNGISVDGV